MWFKIFYCRIDGGVLVLKSILEFLWDCNCVVVEFDFGFGGWSEGCWLEGFEFGLLFGIMEGMCKLN